MKSAVAVETSKVQSTNIFSEMLVNRWLKFAGVAEKSVTTYMTSIKQMYRYFQENGIVKPSREDLENWRDSLIDSGKSPSTVRLYLTSCKLFFRFLDTEGIYKNIADHLKVKVRVSTEHKRDFLSKDQQQQLMQFAKGTGTLKNLRDRAIISLMLTAGLRTIEICRADVKDIVKVGSCYFLNVQGKGKFQKSQQVKVAPQVYSLIQAYLKARKAKGNEPLFTSTSRRNFGKRLDTQTIRKMIKTDLRGIGLDSNRLSAHSLRHSAATTMLLAGVALEKVQQILRHISINTTMIYNHAIERMKNDGENIAANILFQ